jgi:hypothetical protein
MQLFRRTEPNELDQRATELARQRKELAAHGEELDRIEAASRAAKAEQDAAEAEVRRVHDPLADMPLEVKDVAMRRMRDARRASQKAEADRAAFPHTRESLDKCSKQSLAEEQFLDQARDQAQHKAITERKLKAALDLESAELEEYGLLQRAYARWPEDNGAILKGAALPILTFPGTFVPSAATAGHTAKSVFADDFLPMVGRCYPDLLDLLPADRAAVVRDKIQADETRGVFTFAGKSPWHIAEMHGARGPQLARGAIRRGIRDL